MNTEAINHKNIFYPPGGILIWIIIFLELITFGIALIAMVVSNNEGIIPQFQVTTKYSNRNYKHNLFGYKRIFYGKIGW